jgi:hypothetical protein
MNFFPVLFAAFWLGSIALDFVKWKRGEFADASKTLYFMLHAATLALFASYVSHIHVPMPTEPFTGIAAKWVKSIIWRYHHA